MLVTFFTLGYLFMQVHTKRALYLSHRANASHIDEPTLEVFASGDPQAIRRAAAGIIHENFRSRITRTGIPQMMLIYWRLLRDDIFSKARAFSLAYTLHTYSTRVVDMSCAVVWYGMAKLRALVLLRYLSLAQLGAQELTIRWENIKLTICESGPSVVS